MLEELNLLEDKGQLLERPHDRVLELSQVEGTLHVFIFIVSKHVHFGLDLLLALEHCDLIISVVKVVEVRWPKHGYLLVLTFLVLILHVRFLRHSFPFGFLVLIQLLIMIH